jgi:hypothetical protein
VGGVHLLRIYPESWRLPVFGFFNQREKLILQSKSLYFYIGKNNGFSRRIDHVYGVAEYLLEHFELLFS